MKRSVLAEDIAKAREHHPDYLIIATTGTIVAGAKDWLNEQQHICGFRIVLWERLHLHILLGRHQDLRAQFLKAEVDRDFFLKQLALAGKPLATLDAIFNAILDPSVRRALAVACELSLEHSTLLTTGHILYGLLSCDSAYVTQTFQKAGADPTAVSQAVAERWIPRQTFFPTRQLGIRVSVAARLAFETSLTLATRHSAGILTEQVLLAALLNQRRSESLSFIARECGVEIDRVRAQIDILDDVSDITLGTGDSGYNLHPTDSGLSLEEEPLELGGWGVDSLGLPDDEEIVALGSDSDAQSLDSSIPTVSSVSPNSEFDESEEDEEDIESDVSSDVILSPICSVNDATSDLKLDIRPGHIAADQSLVLTIDDSEQLDDVELPPFPSSHNVAADSEAVKLEIEMTSGAVPNAKAPVGLDNSEIWRLPIERRDRGQ